MPKSQISRPPTGSGASIVDILIYSATMDCILSGCRGGYGMPSPHDMRAWQNMCTYLYLCICKILQISASFHSVLYQYLLSSYILRQFPSYPFWSLSSYLSCSILQLLPLDVTALRCSNALDVDYAICVSVRFMPPLTPGVAWEGVHWEGGVNWGGEEGVNRSKLGCT